MKTFHSPQLDSEPHTRKNENAGTFNFTSPITPSICTVMFTEHEKSGATIFTSRRSRWLLISNFRQRQALPLVKTRFLRLANSSPKTARSPTRRSRDVRETSGKKSGEMSRVISAQRPGNGRTVATAMPLNVRQDDSQDNLSCAGFGRAMSAPETCETTRNLAAQQPRNSRATAHATSRKQLVRISPSAFNHDIPKL